MKSYRNTVLSFIAFTSLVLAGSLPAHASGGGKAFAEGVNYIAISPPLIVNYGGPGKARFIKAELSLRVESAADATEVTHHLPLIRDRLITILSEQTEEVISTAEGKEKLRLLALDEINKALHEVEGTGHDEHGKEETHDAKEDKHKDKEGETKSAGDNGAEVATTKGPASDLFFNNFVVQK